MKKVVIKPVKTCEDAIQVEGMRRPPVKEGQDLFIEEIGRRHQNLGPGLGKGRGGIDVKTGLLVNPRLVLMGRPSPIGYENLACCIC